jgi:hypothetical protein
VVRQLGSFVLNDDAVTSAKLQIRGKRLDEKKATSTKSWHNCLKTSLSSLIKSAIETADHGSVRGVPRGARH